MSSQNAQPTLAEAAVPRRTRSFAPLVIAGLIAVIGFAVVGTSTSGGAGMFNYSLAQIQGQTEALAGKNVKVSGRIGRGSVRGEPASDSFRFDLEDDDGNKLAVSYKRLLPDPFEEGRDAIVEGQIHGGVLRASNLTVKCPSRYEDSQSMTPEQQKRYYDTDYKKHKAANPAANPLH